MATFIAHFCFILLLSLLPTEFAVSFLGIAQPPKFNGGPSPTPTRGPIPPPTPKGPSPLTPPLPPPPSQHPSPTPASAPADAAVEGSSSGLSGGQKAGIAIGVIAGATVLGLGGMVYKKRRSNVRKGQYGHAARATFL